MYKLFYIIYIFCKGLIFLITSVFKIAACTGCLTETCTAPKNRGGGGAEDDKNLNVVAVAATA
jgi:hypothetical protein